MSKKEKIRRKKEISDRSRAKYKCPPELVQIIKSVNLISPGVEMPNLVFSTSDKLGEYTLIELKENYGDDFKDVILKSFEKTFNLYTLTFQKALLEHVLSEPGANFGIGNKQLPDKPFYFNVFLAYMDFRRLRKELLQIVDYFTKGRKNEYIPIADDWIYTEDEEAFRLPSTNTPLAVTGTIIEAKLTGLAKALNGVDGNRLRICEICKHIYWAKREDAETCSLKCANNLRVRRYRILSNEEKAERKAKRIANREIIKKGKAKITKRND